MWYISPDRWQSDFPEGGVMRFKKYSCFQITAGLCFFMLSGFVMTLSGTPKNVHHEITVEIKPEEHHILVADEITLERGENAGEEDPIYFLLLKDLKVVADADNELTGYEKINPAHFGLDEKDLPSGSHLKEYSVVIPPEKQGRKVTLYLQYQGVIHFSLEEEEENYAKSFERTSGTISPEGVMLHGRTFWYPWFSDAPVSFKARIRMPRGWHALCQGTRIHGGESESITGSREKRQLVIWNSPKPTDEIYLVAGRFTVYERNLDHADASGQIDTYAYLRTPDEKLAATYLDANEKYIPMYERLIGRYPYGKFALVENFWETGYGMPSFTLLGPKVIRLPFIPVSSYPHEILHNWWGNGVFVDWKTGNWCEGITAYMADHLIKEQQGQGREYRKAALQKYRDYVKKERDFPLTAFRERHSSASEAVGYGKSLMAFHMLRKYLGDETFIAAFQHFYRTNRFRQAGFRDIKDSVETVSGKDFGWFFEQWVENPGAPELALDSVEVAENDRGYRLKIKVLQIQEGLTFRMSIPVAIILEGMKEPLLRDLEMQEKDAVLEVETGKRPVEVLLDPGFDVFRKLHRKEIPPSLSQTLGAQKLLIILPTAEQETPYRDAYRALAEKWASEDSDNILVKEDAEVSEDDMTGCALWVFGRFNRFAEIIETGCEAYDVSFGPDHARLGASEFPWTGHTVVVTVSHPGDEDLSATWLVLDPLEALPGFERKIPHYGKYSCLAFEGNDPTNIVKDRWPVIGSPLQHQVTYPGESVRIPEKIEFPPEVPLVREESIFSIKRMAGTVDYLASEKMAGRGLGTPELDQAASYIAERFREAGLLPGGDDGGYDQSWTEPDVKGKKNVSMKNVIGILPGGKPEMSGESVVIGAHYDHLGTGWPDVRAGNEGKIHPGADDNASGVALMLELAGILAQSGKPDRTLVFVAFTGEESGLVGARHYLEHPGKYPVDKIMAMINLDTVGRLEGKKLVVFGVESAKEFTHLIMGCGFVTGLQVDTVRGEWGAADHLSFLEKGVPALQFFSGTHLDYHQPSDTAEKIDYDGMQRIAAFTREAIAYLSAREDPLSISISGFEKTGQEEDLSGSTTRKASLGTVPDFAYTGKGFRLADVVPGSPAAEGGLQKGDIVTSLDSTPVNSLRDLSVFLKEHAPGDTVEVTFLRNEEEKKIRVTLGAR